MSTGGVTLRQEEIRLTLSRADETARFEGDALIARTGSWRHAIEALRVEDCPKTYLPVLAVLLTARTMRSAAELDVLDIQQQTSSRGYAAASIGGLIVSFAREQGVSLRAKSSQIMNNQPFTFKPRILPDMSKPAKAAYYSAFYSAAVEVNALTPTQAADVLALLFHICRVDDQEGVDAVTIGGGKAAMLELLDRTAQFVLAFSDNGKVGQAFVAACLDTLYGSDVVDLGNTADPDAGVPGDVQVRTREEVAWLWCEVKQKVISTGDVETFIAKVRRVGGGRIHYCALANERYPLNIDQRKVQVLADAAKITVDVYLSPGDYLGAIVNWSPGSFDEVASAFATAMIRRLHESGCHPDTVASYRGAAGV